jgi:hypothetical protein
MVPPAAVLADRPARARTETNAVGRSNAWF